MGLLVPHILASPYRDVLIVAFSPRFLHLSHLADWLARLQFPGISRPHLIPLSHRVRHSSADWLTDWMTDWMTNWLTDGLTGWQGDKLANWLAVQVVFNFNKFPVHVSKRDSWQLQLRFPIFLCNSGWWWVFVGGMLFYVLVHCWLKGDGVRKTALLPLFLAQSVTITCPTVCLSVLGGVAEWVVKRGWWPAKDIAVAMWHHDIFYTRRRVTLSFHLFLFCAYFSSTQRHRYLYIPRPPPTHFLNHLSVG